MRSSQHIRTQERRIIVVLLVALATGALVARSLVKSSPGQPRARPLATILDMLLVGVVVARLVFVLAWLPEYLADPWSIIRIGDGGFSLWAGVPAGQIAYRPGPTLAAKTARSAGAGSC